MSVFIVTDLETALVKCRQNVAKHHMNVSVGGIFFITLGVLSSKKLQPVQERDRKGQLECGREADLDETSNQLT